MAMTTHMPYDPYINAETIAEIREHWKGPFHFGAPDMVVVNVTKESIWVRDGVIPDYPNVKAPNADASIQKYGGLHRSDAALSARGPTVAVRPRCRDRSRPLLPGGLQTGS